MPRTAYLGIMLVVGVANRTIPPRLPMHGLAVGLLVDLLSIFVWLLALVRHFRRPSRDSA